MADEKIIDKIRKLIAKANDTSCTVAEADSFMQKAHELMVTYNVERSQLDVQGNVNGTVFKHYSLKTLIRPFSKQIINGITHLYGCKWYYSRDVATFYGEEQSAAMAHSIAIMVLRAVQQEARRTDGGRSFMFGAAVVIDRRCREMKAAEYTQARVAGGSNALVVLQQHDEEGAKNYLATTLNVKLTTAKPKQVRIRDASGYGAGQAFGATVQLRRNLLG